MKLLPAACALAFGLSFISVRGDDTPIQAAARAALEQKLQDLDKPPTQTPVPAQPGKSATNAVTKAVPAKKTVPQTAPTVTAKPASVPVAKPVVPAPPAPAPVAAPVVVAPAVVTPAPAPVVPPPAPVAPPPVPVAPAPAAAPAAPVVAAPADATPPPAESMPAPAETQATTAPTTPEQTPTPAETAPAATPAAAVPATPPPAETKAAESTPQPSAAAPTAAPAPAPAETQPVPQDAARAALEQKLYELDKTPTQPTAAPGQVSGSPEKPGIATPQSQVTARIPGKELGLKSIESPLMPISSTQLAQLQDLLGKYERNEITPAEYHRQRAAILAQSQQ